MVNDTINNDMTMGGAAATLLAGRYRVVRQLGQGGMGSVWLAEDTKLDGFKVAIKMLPSILVNNKRAYAQVKAEALVSLKLSHPNIATVRAFEEESGSPFLVMDYIDGQTLDDYLAEKGKLTEEETVKLLKPVAAALDYAHAQGVVHRDVKPGNVIIRKDGVPFVLDFGIAREIQETMTRVTGKLSSGTLLYMSPEQLNGDAPKPAQDVYSFAAMVYECLTGAPPFIRGGIEDQIKHKAPDKLPEYVAISSGVMAGLEKDSIKRPQNCVAVLEVGTTRAKTELHRTQPSSLATVIIPEQDVRFLPPGDWRRGDGSPHKEDPAAEKQDFSKQEITSNRDYRPAGGSQERLSPGASYGWLLLVAIVIGLIALGKGLAEYSKSERERPKQTVPAVNPPRIYKSEPITKIVEQELPSVYVTASINGSLRKATFVSGVNEAGATTPTTVNLKSLAGQKWSCKLRYVEDGVTYEGEGFCVATPGRQTLDVKLSPAVPLFDRPADMNFCRHCRAPLSSYPKVPRNCPKCGKDLFARVETQPTRSWSADYKPPARQESSNSGVWGEVLGGVLRGIAAGL